MELENQKTSKFDLIITLLPTVLFISVVILIARQYTYTEFNIDHYWLSENNGHGDYFVTYRRYAIYISTFCAVIILLFKMINSNINLRWNAVYIPMGVYCFFVIISSIFSEVSSADQMKWLYTYEGTLAVLCYMFMLFYIINTIDSEKKVKIVIYSLSISVVFLSIIGASQALDHSILEYPIVQKIIVPNTAVDNTTTWQLIDDAAAKGEVYYKLAWGKVSQILGNSGVVAFYLVLVIPIFVLLFIQGKKVSHKILWACVYALSFYNFINTSSFGGVVGAIVVIIVLAITMQAQLAKHWKSFLLLFLVSILILGLSYSTITKEVVGTVKRTSDSSSRTPAREHQFDYFDTDGETLYLSYDGNKCSITINEHGELNTLDNENNALELSDEDICNIEDQRFKSLYIAPLSEGNALGFELGIEGEEIAWPFVYTDNGLRYINDYNKEVDLDKVEHIGFEDNPWFGSGRGYIWSVSFPMLKDNLILGDGPSTYWYYANSNKDYISKYNLGFKINHFIFSPHNTFINTAQNTGVISMIALMWIFGLYIIQSFMVYRNRVLVAFSDFVGIGIFAGVCGFLTISMLIDSKVITSPMFYGLLGVGFAINYKLKKQGRSEKISA